jgi:hypothetical protein
MTGDQVFAGVLLYSLGYVGSALWLRVFQGDAVGSAWGRCLFLALFWPAVSLGLPVVLGLVAGCLAVSGEWRMFLK